MTLQSQVFAPIKRNRQKLASSTALIMVLGFVGAQASAQTLPTDGTVVAGGATIGAPSGGTLGVALTAGKPNTVINWKAFSIGSGGTVNFTGTAGQSVLNRVIGDLVVIPPSVIDGALNSSAGVHVWLLNPSGVLLGSTGAINTGSFFASTLNITNADFTDGNSTYSLKANLNEGGGADALWDPAIAGEVKFTGNASGITAGTGAIVGIGQLVTADGKMTATAGDIALVAAKDVTVDFTAGSPLSMVINAGTTIATAKVNVTGNGNMSGNSVVVGGMTTVSLADALLGVSSGASLKASNVDGRVIISVGQDVAATAKSAGLSFASPGKAANIVASATSISSGSDVIIKTAGDVTVNGGVSADKDYVVAGTNVVLGGTQSAKGAAIVLGADLKANLTPLVLTANSDGVGTEALSLTATTGAIDFTGSTLNGGTAKQSDVSLSAAGDIKIGKVSARELQGLGALTKSVSTGDLSLTNALKIVTSSGNILTGKIDATNGVTLTNTDALISTGAIDVTGANKTIDILALGPITTSGKLSADGNISVKSTNSGLDLTDLKSTSGSISLSAADASKVKGTVSAGKDYDVIGTTIELGGAQSADGKLSVNADTITVEAGGLSLTSNADNKGAEDLKITTTTDLDLTKANLNASTTNLSNLVISQAASKNVALGDISALGITGLDTLSGNLTVAKVDVASSLSLKTTAGNISAAAVTVAGSGNTLSIDASGQLDTTGAISADGDVSAKSGAGLKVFGASSTKGNLDLTSGGGAILDGSFTAGGDYSITATSGTLDIGGTHSADGKVTIDAKVINVNPTKLNLTGNADNTGAEDLQVSSTSSIDLSQATLKASTNQTSNLVIGLAAGQSLKLGDVNALGLTGLSAVSGAITTGKLELASNLNITSSSGNIETGAITITGASKTVTLDASGGTLTTKGDVSADGAVSLKSGAFLSAKGLNSTSGNVTVTSTAGAADIIGNVTAGGDYSVKAIGLVTIGGNQSAKGAVSIEGASITKDVGVLTLASDTDNNAVGDLSLKTNGGGSIALAGVALNAGLNVATPSKSTNVSIINSGGALTIGDVNAKALTNTGAITNLLSGNINVTDSLTLTAGTIQTGNITIAGANKTVLLNTFAGGTTIKVGDISADGSINLQSGSSVDAKGLKSTSGSIFVNATTTASVIGAVTAGSSYTVIGNNGITLGGTQSAKGTVSIFGTGIALDASGLTLTANSDNAGAEGLLLTALSSDLDMTKANLNASTDKSSNLVISVAAGKNVALGDVSALELKGLSALSGNVSLGNVSVVNGLDVNTSGGNIDTGTIAVSGGGFGVSLKATKAGSTLTTKGAIDVAADIILESGSDLNLTDLKTKFGNIDLKAPNNITVNGTVESGGNYNILSSAGTITLGGNQSAKGAVSIEGASITKDVGGVTLASDTDNNAIGELTLKSTGAGGIALSGVTLNGGLNGVTPSQSVAVRVNTDNLGDAIVGDVNAKVFTFGGPFKNITTGNINVVDNLSLIANSIETGTINVSGLGKSVFLSTVGFAAIKVGDISADGDVVLQSGTSLDAKGLKSSSGFVSISSGKTLSVIGTVTADQGYIINAGEGVTLGGDQSTKGALTINGKSIALDVSGLTLTANSDNSGFDDLTLNATASDINLTKANLNASTDKSSNLVISVAAGKNVALGDVSALGILGLNAVSGNVSLGNVSVVNGLAVNTSGGNIDTGTIAVSGAGQALTLNASGTIKANGDLSSGGDLSTTSGTDTTLSGLKSNSGFISVVAGGKANIVGTVSAGTNYTVTGKSITLGGAQSANGAILISGDSVIVDAGGLTLTSDLDDSGAQSLDIKTKTALDLSNSTLNGGTKLSSIVNVTAPGAVTLGDVNALSLDGLTAVAGDLTVGDVTTSKSINLQSATGKITTGALNVTGLAEGIALKAFTTLSTTSDLKAAGLIDLTAGDLLTLNSVESTASTVIINAKGLTASDLKAKFAVSVTAATGGIKLTNVTSDTQSLISSGDITVTGALTGTSSVDVKANGAKATISKVTTSTGSIAVVGKNVDVTNADAKTSLNLSTTAGVLTLGTGKAGTTATVQSKGGDATVATSLTSDQKLTFGASGGAAKAASLTTTTSDISVSGDSVDVANADAKTDLALTSTISTLTIGVGKAGGKADLISATDATITTSLTSVGDLNIKATGLLKAPSVTSTSGNIVGLGKNVDVTNADAKLSLSLQATNGNLLLDTGKAGTVASVSALSGNATVTTSLTAGQSLILGAVGGDVKAATLTSTNADIDVSGKGVDVTKADAKTSLNLTASAGKLALGTGAAGSSLLMTANAGDITLGTGTAGTTATLDAKAGNATVTTSLTSDQTLKMTATGGTAKAGQLTTTATDIVVSADTVDITNADSKTDLSLTSTKTTLTLGTGTAGGKATLTGNTNTTVTTSLNSVGDLNIKSNTGDLKAPSLTSGAGLIFGLGKNVDVTNADAKLSLTLQATNGNLLLDTGKAGTLASVSALSGNATVTTSLTAGQTLLFGAVGGDAKAALLTSTNADIDASGVNLDITNADAKTNLKLTSGTGQLKLGTGTAGNDAFINAVAGDVTIASSLTTGNLLSITANTGAVTSPLLKSTGGNIAVLGNTVDVTSVDAKLAMNLSGFKGLSVSTANAGTTADLKTTGLGSDLKVTTSLISGGDATITAGDLAHIESVTSSTGGISVTLSGTGVLTDASGKGGTKLDAKTNILTKNGTQTIASLKAGGSAEVLDFSTATIIGPVTAGNQYRAVSFLAGSKLTIGGSQTANGFVAMGAQTVLADKGGLTLTANADDIGADQLVIGSPISGGTVDMTGATLNGGTKQSSTIFVSGVDNLTLDTVNALALTGVNAIKGDIKFGTLNLVNSLDAQSLTGMISADKITVSGPLQGITLKAATAGKTVTLTGDVNADGNIDITSGSLLDLKNVTSTSGSVALKGVGITALDLKAKTDLNLTSDPSGKGINIQNGSADKALLISAGDIDIVGALTTDNGQSITANGKATANKLQSLKADIAVSAQSVDVNTADAATSLSLTATKGNVDLTKGSAGTTTTIKASLDAKIDDLLGVGDIVIEADQLANLNKITSSAGSITIDSGVIQAETLDANKALEATATVGDLVLKSGKSGTDALLKTTGAGHVTVSSTMVSSGNLLIDSNQNAQLVDVKSTGGSVNVTAKNDITGLTGGDRAIIEAKFGDVSLKSGGKALLATVLSGAKTDISALSVDATNLTSGKAMSITATGGTIIVPDAVSADTMTFKAVNAITSTGQLKSNGALSLTSTTAGVTAADLVSLTGAVTASGATLDVTKADAKTDLSLTSSVGALKLATGVAGGKATTLSATDTTITALNTVGDQSLTASSGVMKANGLTSSAGSITASGKSLDVTNADAKLALSLSSTNGTATLATGKAGTTASLNAASGNATVTTSLIASQKLTLGAVGGDAKAVSLTSTAADIDVSGAAVDVTLADAKTNLKVTSSTGALKLDTGTAGNDAFLNALAGDATIATNLTTGNLLSITANKGTVTAPLLKSTGGTIAVVSDKVAVTSADAKGALNLTGTNSLTLGTGIAGTTADLKTTGVGSDLKVTGSLTSDATQSITSAGAATLNKLTSTKGSVLVTAITTALINTPVVAGLDYTVKADKASLGGAQSAKGAVSITANLIENVGGLVLTSNSDDIGSESLSLTTAGALDFSTAILNGGANKTSDLVIAGGPVSINLGQVNARTITGLNALNGDIDLGTLVLTNTLDVGSLNGSIKADKITITGTNQGLSLKTMAAGKSITATGDLKADGAVNLNSAGDLNATTITSTSGDVTLKANTIKALSTTAGGNLSAEALTGSITLPEVTSGGTLALKALGDVTVATKAESGSSLSLTSTNGKVTANSLKSLADSITVSGQTADLTTVEAAKAMTVTTLGDMTIASATAGTTADLKTTGTGTINVKSLTAGTATTIDSKADARLSTIKSGSTLSVTAVGEITGATSADRADLEATTGALTLKSGAKTLLGKATSGALSDISAANADIATLNSQSLVLKTTVGSAIIGTGTVAATSEITTKGQTKITSLTSGGTSKITSSNNADITTISTKAGDIIITATEVIISKADAKAGLDLKATTGDITVGTASSGTTTAMETLGAGGKISLTGSLTSGDKVTITSLGAIDLQPVTSSGDVTITTPGLLSLSNVSANGKSVTLNAKDGEFSQDILANTITINAAQGLRLGTSPQGTAGFDLSEAELNRLKASGTNSAVSLDSKTAGIQIGTVSWTLIDPATKVSLFTTGRIDITGRFATDATSGASGSTTQRTVVMGGSSTDANAVASVIRIVSTASAGGRIDIGLGSLDLRGASIGAGQDTDFLTKLGLDAAGTPISSSLAATNFVNNAQSSLYKPLVPYTDRVLVKAGKLSVTYRDFALFQNTGAPGINDGIVLGSATGTPITSTLAIKALSTSTDNAFAFFGKINNVTERAVPLLGATFISVTPQVTGSKSRVNGCFIGSTSACLSSSLAQPSMNLFDVNKVEVFKTVPAEISFDSVLSTNNESLFSDEVGGNQCAKDDKRAECQASGAQ